MRYHSVLRINLTIRQKKCASLRILGCPRILIGTRTAPVGEPRASLPCPRRVRRRRRLYNQAPQVRHTLLRSPRVLCESRHSAPFRPLGSVSPSQPHHWCHNAYCGLGRIVDEKFVVSSWCRFIGPAAVAAVPSGPMKRHQLDTTKLSSTMRPNPQ